MTTSTAARDTARDPAGEAPPRPRRGRLVERVALGAVLAFALLGIGTPLLGLTTFANTDLLVNNSPYVGAGLAQPQIENNIANDVVASVLPGTSLFADELRHGRLAAWNPYVGGGGTLGAVPNFAVLSPLTVPYYVLPASMAPAFVKLLEILVAAGGAYLFLRRLRLGRAAALLGGLAFTSSGFMIAWTNWPQTRVAAFIPAVFWATERLAEHRRVRDGALLAVALAAMLFGGFPAVTGYTVLTAGGYLLVRAIARGRPLAPLLAGAGALVGAVMITAIQLLPFVAAMRHARLSGRGQTGADHLDPTALITAWAPWSLGRVNTFPLRDNAVELLSYVGAAGLVLFLLAVALPAAGRAFLPRGVWAFFVAATAGWAVLIYLGGLPLEAVQQLPVLFADNFVGRARSVLGFLIAVLIAVGFEIALRWVGAVLDGPEARPAPVRGRSRVWAIGVAGAGLVGLAVTTLRGFLVVDGPDSVVGPGWFAVRVGAGLAIIALTVLAVAVLWRSGAKTARPRLAVAAAAVVPALLLVQALATVYAYWPRVDRDTWYPRTDVHQFLSANLGHDRFAAAEGGMYPGADSAARLRSLTGEAFFDLRFAETIRGLPGEKFSSTLLRLPATADVARSALLDRLSVRYLVTTPWEKPFGPETAEAGDGRTVTIRPGEPRTVRLTARGPIRGVAVTPAEAGTKTTRLSVSLRDAAGAEVAKGGRPLLEKAGTPAYVAVAGDRVPAGAALTAMITVEGGPVRVAAVGDRPAVSTVAAADDGLRIAYAGNSTVWERTTVLPRIRWASEVHVGEGPGPRVRAMRDGGLRPDQVVLDAPPASPVDGRPATVTVLEDGTDDIAARVDAQGAGYLVVADPLQHGWGVTVDGKAATLIPADNGLVAVAVPAGSHTVRLAYRMPMHNAGAWISGAALIGLLGIAAGVVVRRRRPTA
ncbi:YfhO family protein [Asanoa sp. WMMD1127]|uniref:YfhO family protein n=1 Tax=Asanoa sp. WMMD1127 TaxID=3016107 RepID=UPI002415DDB8|nr:YfhO family protein [Asanoa sp. WMMD1127]MDG4824516.1 YfhO family protein [Asanoa sp. WMMD1127]